jgi:hypothetical protein
VDLNPAFQGNPDPTRIQGFDYQKLHFIYPKASKKDIRAKEALNPPKKTSITSTKKVSFYEVLDVHFCPPGSGFVSGLRIRIRIHRSNPESGYGSGFTALRISTISLLKVMGFLMTEFVLLPCVSTSPASPFCAAISRRWRRPATPTR